MKITVIGAGAMGGSYGGLLAVAGHEVSLIDAWQAHVDAINRDGLRVDGVRGDHRVRVAASTDPIGDGAELAIVFVDANNTAAAAETARRVLAPDGFAITFQNGIGNVEKLQAALGRGAGARRLQHVQRGDLRPGSCPPHASRQDLDRRDRRCADGRAPRASPRSSTMPASRPKSCRTSWP